MNFKDVLKRISEEKTSLEFFPEFNDEEKIVLAALKNDGHMLKFASERLKNKPAVVLKAVEADKDALKHAAEGLRNDEAFMFKQIKAHPSQAQYLGRVLNVDHVFHETTMKKLGSEFLEYAAPELKKDKDFFIKILEIDKTALKYADPALKDDKDVVIASIRWGGTESYMGDTLKNDRAFIDELIEKNLVRPGSDFSWLGDALRADKDFLSKHIPKHPLLFTAASEAVQKSKGFILKFTAPTVSQLFAHIDAAFKDDLAFLKEAVKIDPEILKLADKQYKKELKAELKQK